MKCRNTIHHSIVYIGYNLGNNSTHLGNFGYSAIGEKTTS